MKRTLKCAVAMAGAAAVMIGASVPAGAFNVKTQTKPCYSCGNSSEANNVNSIIKNILEKGCSGSDCNVIIKGEIQETQGIPFRSLFRIIPTISAKYGK